MTLELSPFNNNKSPYKIIIYYEDTSPFNIQLLLLRIIVFHLFLIVKVSHSA